MVKRASGQEKYFSMAELAARLNLPESTLRYYCKRFAAYLPGAGEGRRRRYAPECQGILDFIASSMQRHKNAMTVELLLKDNGGKTFATLDGASISSSSASSQAAPAANEYAAASLPANALPPVRPTPAHGLAQAVSLGVPAYMDETVRSLSVFMEKQSSALDRIAGALDSLAGSMSGMLSAMERNKECALEASEALEAFPAPDNVNKAAQEKDSQEKEALERLARAEAALSDSAALEAAREEGRAMSREVRELRSQLVAAEKLHQQDLEQLRKWLARLGEMVANR